MEKSVESLPGAASVGFFFSSCSFTSTLLELSFRKNATRRAVGESRAELFSLKKISQLTVSSAVRMFSLAVFQPLGNNCTTKIYCILRANKHEREMWSSAFRLG